MKRLWLLVLPWSVVVSSGGSCGDFCEKIPGTYIYYKGIVVGRVDYSTGSWAADVALDIVDVMNDAHERREKAKGPLRAEYGIRSQDRSGGCIQAGADKFGDAVLGPCK